MPGAVDGSLQKFHLSMNVSALDRAIRFYRVLLGTEPAKIKSDYAKFDLAEPPLVLSLVPGQSAPGGHLNHVGLRVRNAEELLAIQHRLEAAGMPTERQDGVECCYARQTKFWISDPDGVLWEIYVFHADVEDQEAASPQRVERRDAPATPVLSTLAWEHHLRDVVPARIPHDDNALHAVRLEGSINLAPGTEHLAGLFADTLRVLRPGAAVHVHGLAGDRECASALALPGPAAAVQHVPAVSAVIEGLAAAGFVDIAIEKLSETAYFVVDGVPMRELRVVARKRGHRPRIQSHQAIYLGPLREVVDDFGNSYRRGVPTAVNVHDWQILSKSAVSNSFLLLKPDASRDASCSERPVAATSG